MGRLQGLWQWFLARPMRTKVVLGVVVAGLAVVLSPLLSVVAIVALSVSIVAVIIQLLRRQSVRTWMLVGGASLALSLVSGGVSDALYGGPVEQANAPRTSSSQQAELEKAKQEAEEARQEAEAAKQEAARAKAEATQAKQEAEAARAGSEAEAKEANQGEADGGAAANVEPDSQVEEKAEPVLTKEKVEKPSQPKPQTPVERLRSRIEKTFVIKKDLRGIWIRDSGAGCKNVAVGFVAEGWTAGGTVDSIEFQMEDVYKAAYGDPQLASVVCYVTVNAYTKLTDRLGNVTTEKVYSTSMDQATGNSINWRNSYAVDFPSVWAVNYEHPVYTRQKAQNEVEKAVDCAEDEGLFDLQPLDCP